MRGLGEPPANIQVSLGIVEKSLSAVSWVPSTQHHHHHFDSGPVIAHQSLSRLLPQPAPWTSVGWSVLGGGPISVTASLPGWGASLRQPRRQPRRHPCFLLCRLPPCPSHSRGPPPRLPRLCPRPGMRPPLEPGGSPDAVLSSGSGHRPCPRSLVASVSRICRVAQTACPSYMLRWGRGFCSILSNALSEEVFQIGF